MGNGKKELRARTARSTGRGCAVVQCVCRSKNLGIESALSDHMMIFCNNKKGAMRGKPNKNSGNLKVAKFYTLTLIV